jgi:DNA-binding transcriptional LysR family regulator
VTLGEILEKRLVLQKFALEEMRLLFAKYNFPVEDIKTCAVTTRDSILLEYLRDGIGISIMSRRLADNIDPHHDLVRIPIAERPELTLGMLIKSKPLSQPCVRLINFISDAITDKTDNSGTFVS